MKWLLVTKLIDIYLSQNLFYIHNIVDYSQNRKKMFFDFGWAMYKRMGRNLPNLLLEVGKMAN